MPTLTETGANPAMMDPFGRMVTYLRVSVTDRCDFRCTYCMAEDMTFLPKRDLLTLEELDRLCSVFVEKGVRKLRLTGGEPLVRKNIMTLLAQLKPHLEARDLDEVTLTKSVFVVDGGLHHQLAASGNFGTVVRRNYPVAVTNRFGAETVPEPVTIVGCLCTPLDRLADKVMLPEVAPGDLIAVFMAGAYGATASPSAFLGHAPALEMLVEA